MSGDGFSATAHLIKGEHCMERKERLAKQRKRLRFVIAIAVAVLVALIVLLFWLGRNDSLTGSWEFEDTFFEFDGQGKGVWMQGDELERFSYEIHGTEVAVDFRREDVPDVTYRFYIEGEYLVLTDSEGNQIALTKTSK